MVVIYGYPRFIIFLSYVNLSSPDIACRRSLKKIGRTDNRCGILTAIDKGVPEAWRKLTVKTTQVNKIFVTFSPSSNDDLWFTIKDTELILFVGKVFELNKTVARAELEITKWKFYDHLSQQYSFQFVKTVMIVNVLKPEKMGRCKNAVLSTRIRDACITLPGSFKKHGNTIEGDNDKHEEDWDHV